MKKRLGLKDLNITSFLTTDEKRLAGGGYTMPACPTLATCPGECDSFTPEECMGPMTGPGEYGC